MYKDFFVYVAAIAVGNGMGFMLSVAGQQMLNKQQIGICPSKPDHSLIMIRSFIGDAYYCIDNRYLSKD